MVKTISLIISGHKTVLNQIYQNMGTDCGLDLWSIIQNLLVVRDIIF